MSISSSSSTRRCMRFSISEIKAATNQFDRSKILGQGGEAKVYFAEIYIGLNKTPVAVKHLEDNAKEFEREIYTLSKIQHSNLVSLIGYCDESGHKILVYEYMARGCLSDYLKMNSFISLSWLQRLNICLDVARGLQHLHTVTHEFPKGIIHRDVKPGNILVGENWAAKLSDFGMFKLSNAGQDKSLMIASLKGTSGYFAPEYIDNGCITRKIDVYSFGVVLFQVLYRKMPWDRGDESYYAREEEDLGYWAQQNVDAQIQGEILGDSLTIFTNIIRRSLQANPDRRPTMDNVVLDLQEALEWQETGRRPTVDGEVAYLRMALECQESENLTNQLERFDGFHHKSPRGLTEDRSVKQLLLRKALIVPETTSIRKACSQMASHMTDVLLLSDSVALLCGILTYKDIATKVIACELNPENTPVSNVMTRNHAFVLSETLAVEALQMMVQGKFRHLPVVENDEVIALLNIENCLYDAIAHMEKGNAITDADEGFEKHWESTSVDGPDTFIEKLQEQMFWPSLSTIITENSKVVTVSPSDTVVMAAKKMLESQISSVVVTVDNKLLGILTSQDLLMRVISQDLPLDSTRVEKVMTPNPECATVDTPIIDALHAMHDGNFVHLPVVDEDGIVVAVVDVSHITHAVVGKVKFTLSRQSSLGPETRNDCIIKNDSGGSDEIDPWVRLMYLASEGDLEGLNELLDSGINVNFRDTVNRTALHVAACQGFSDVAELLLQRGAEVDPEDHWGNTPLAEAIHNKSHDVIKHLERHGAKPLMAAMYVKNTREVPEYEIDSKELDFTNSVDITKGTFCIALWHGTQVAVKRLRDDVFNDEEKVRAFRDELELLQKIRHPHVVQFFGAVTQSSPMMIVTEYLPKGDFRAYLKRKGPLKPLLALRIAMDIARGMNYLHENKPDPIIHGALEPSNILRDNSGHLKVASFGVKEVRPLTYEDTTCRYVAPEVFRNEEYDTKVDVFSFALILQEMIEGCGPFPAKNENEVLKAYAVNERPPFRAPSKYYSYGLKEMIKKCWSEKPDKRPTFKEIIPRLESIYDSHVQKPQSKVGLLKYFRKMEAMWKKGGSSQSSSSDSSQEPSVLLYGMGHKLRLRGLGMMSLTTRKKCGRAFRDELELLQKIRHPHVVQFFGAVTQSSPMMIVTEYLPKGDFRAYLKRKGPLKPLLALRIAMDIARGMNYLHENKPDPIIHGALEPSNILRDNSGHLKVASFGVKEVRPLTYEDTTCRYVAPEVFRNEEYDTKVDVFSFALILQEMIEGCGPFPAKNENEVLKAYAVNERPPFRAPSKYYSYGLKEMIKKCWSEKPDKRPTFKEIIPRLESIYDSHVQKPQSKVGLLKYFRKMEAMWKKGGSSQSSSSDSSQ